MFDNEEGEFLKSIHQDGVYYDTKNKRFLISAKADTINGKPGIIRIEPNKEVVKHSEIASIEDVKTENKTLENTYPIQVNTSRRLEKLPSTLNTSTVALQPSVDKPADKQPRISNNVENTQKNITTLNIVSNSTNIEKQQLTNISSDLKKDLDKFSNKSSNVTMQKQSKNLTRSEERNIALKLVKNMLHSLQPIQKHLTMELSKIKNRKALELSRIKKRDVFSDDDPNVDVAMGANGNKLEEYKQNPNTKHNERILKFTRSNVVSKQIAAKIKREAGINPSSVLGIWSGLGTTPEFVPGLFKHDFNESTNRRFKVRRKGWKKHFLRKENSVAADKKRNVEVRERRAGSTLVTSDTQENEKMQGKRELGEYYSQDRDADGSVNSDNEVTSLSKRDSIPKADELDSDDTSENDKKSDVSQISGIDNVEQSESKQMELGSLGSFNMLTHKYVTKKEHVVKGFPQHNSGKNPLKIKRSDKEAEIEINHMTEPVQDGKVVLAFDEVKRVDAYQTIF